MDRCQPSCNQSSVNSVGSGQRICCPLARTPSKAAKSLSQLLPSFFPSASFSALSSSPSSLHLPSPFPSFLLPHHPFPARTCARTDILRAATQVVGGNGRTGAAVVKELLRRGCRSASIYADSAAIYGGVLP
eukprot:2925566-Rhodomonas_salina.3